MFGYQTFELAVDSSKEKTHWKIPNGQYDSQGSLVNHLSKPWYIKKCEPYWKF